MWPKVLAQLIELLPHASRLIPLAEKYFGGQSGPATATLDPDSQKSLADLRTSLTEVRSELASSNSRSESLYRQLNEQTATLDTHTRTLAELLEDTHRTRATLQALDTRLDNLDALQKRTVGLISALFLLLVPTLLFCALAFFLHRH